MATIKICGITTPEDACLAAEAGADAIGLNFYPQSPRFVGLSRAREIAAAVPGSTIRVGVFVNEDVDVMLDLAERVPLDMIQLHGDESSEVLERLSPLPVIRAVRATANTLEQIMQRLDECAQASNVCAVLVDAYVQGEFGGTGQTADWDVARAIAERFRQWPLLLAGGLTPENVAAAIRAARPGGIDVASGVESAPGKKDSIRVREFVRLSREAFAAVNMRRSDTD